MPCCVEEKEAVGCASHAHFFGLEVDPDGSGAGLGVEDVVGVAEEEGGFAAGGGADEEDFEGGGSAGGGHFGEGGWCSLGGWMGLGLAGLFEALSLSSFAFFLSLSLFLCFQRRKMFETINKSFPFQSGYFSISRSVLRVSSPKLESPPLDLYLASGYNISKRNSNLGV